MFENFSVLSTTWNLMFPIYFHFQPIFVYSIKPLDWRSCPFFRHRLKDLDSLDLVSLYSTLTTHRLTSMPYSSLLFIDLESVWNFVAIEFIFDTFEKILSIQVSGSRKLSNWLTQLFSINLIAYWLLESLNLKKKFP